MWYLQTYRGHSFVPSYFTAYNDTMQEHCPTMHKCTPGQYYFQKKFNAPGHTKWSCIYNTTELGPCSGLEDGTFGYNGTQPCVIIKMNRVHNKPSRLIDDKISEHIFTDESYLQICYKWKYRFCFCR